MASPLAQARREYRTVRSHRAKLVNDMEDLEAEIKSLSAELGWALAKSLAAPPSPDRHGPGAGRRVGGGGVGGRARQGRRGGKARASDDASFSESGESWSGSEDDGNGRSGSRSQSRGRPDRASCCSSDDDELVADRGGHDAPQAGSEDDEVEEAVAAVTAEAGSERGSAPPSLRADADSGGRRGKGQGSDGAAVSDSHLLPVARSQTGGGSDLRKALLKGTVAAEEEEASVSSAGPSYEDVLAHTDQKKRQKSIGYIDADDPFRQLQIGIFKFNSRPKDGIRYLEAKGLLHPDPKMHARFLLDTTNLKKTQVGDYIGGDGVSEFKAKVLAEFVALFEFKGVAVLRALRTFLASFHLPGEAQKIERIVEAFAGAYHSQNPDSFAHSADAVMVLAYGIIMLNTDRHSPMVRNKMDLRAFKRNLEGTNTDEKGEHHDFPEDVLTTIFNEIVEEALAIAHDEAEPSTFDHPEKSGWLRKQGGRVKSWKTRWFVLTGNCLYYFQTEESEPKGLVPLENVFVRRRSDLKKKNCFEIYSSDGPLKMCKMESNVFVESHHESLLLRAADDAEVGEWIDALSQNVSINPFHELLRAKHRELRDGTGGGGAPSTSTPGNGGGSGQA